MANGMFGDLNIAEGQIIFYLDRMEPKSDTIGNISLGSVNRELQAEVHLSPAVFKAMADWMTKQVVDFEAQQKQQIASVKMDPTGKYT